MNIFPNLYGNWAKINLNEESLKANLDLSNQDVCEKFVYSLHESKKADFSFGEFLEDRTYLWRNHPGEKAKSLIHAGIDYTVPADTKISLPLDGKLIHVMRDPLNDIGWGGRLIFQLEDENYLLYGHLNQDIELKIGQNCKKDEIVGTVGSRNTNGNWWPHLHAQVMNSKFIDRYSTNLRAVDGYLPAGNTNINNLLDPWQYIF